MIQSFLSLYTELELGTYTLHEPLSKHTTWKIGGPADVMVQPKGKDEIVQTIRLLNECGVPWMAIGRGSNLLVSDKGFRGVVIHTEKGLNYVRFDGGRVTAGAGHSFIKLSVLAGKEGLSGLEYAGGIPGTVGGAVYMNAGAHGSDVSRIFESAEIVLETGELVTYNVEEMQFAYRHSVLHEQKGIVVEATFRMEYGDREAIAVAFASNKERRLQTQPLAAACCGSVFRNPPGDYSARLIEASGLKGFSVGGAEVSTMHANFIVNTGQATASDVLALINHIKETIRKRNEIELVEEVLVAGEW